MPLQSAHGSTPRNVAGSAPTGDWVGGGVPVAAPATRKTASSAALAAPLRAGPAPMLAMYRRRVRNIAKSYSEHSCSRGSSRPPYLDSRLESHRLEQSEHSIDGHPLEAAGENAGHRASRKARTRGHLRVCQAAALDLASDRSNQ